MPGWIIDIVGHLIFWIGIPALLIFSVIVPFLFVKKILKRRFTVVNTLVCIIIATGLLALILYGLYWGVALLQGIGFCNLHGYSTFECLFPNR